MYVGFIDELVDDIVDVPQLIEIEIGFLFDVIGSVFEVLLRCVDVVGMFVGLCLFFEVIGWIVDLSCKHVVLILFDGVVIVVGGKFIIYCCMVEDVVDVVVWFCGLVAWLCSTWMLLFVGVGDTTCLVLVFCWLICCYGIEVGVVAVDPLFFDLISDEILVMMVELVWVVEYEGVFDVEDLLDWCTCVGFVLVDWVIVVLFAE